MKVNTVILLLIIQFVVVNGNFFEYFSLNSEILPDFRDRMHSLRESWLRVTDKWDILNQGTQPNLRGRKLQTRTTTRTRTRGRNGKSASSSTGTNSHGPTWTYEEEEKLMTLQKSIGNDVGSLRSFLPRHSAADIRARLILLRREYASRKQR